ncbi:MAG: ABC transporter ATP-binding protein [Planctomycetaceae bacterium]|nr:ABC transporter ATP-binding protein [Planctomycetaceae bacterium]
MISTSELKFSYPHSDFHLVIDQLTVAAGCATAVVGPSGSGKTTLLHLLAGILTPDAGQIVVGDTPVHSLSEAARRQFRLKQVGLVFQDFELIEYLNVLDNVLLPCRIGHLSLDTATRQRADVLLERVGLSGHRRKSVTRLSQGERQRVAICRALLSQPPLLLADEPTGNLDPETSAHIMRLLLETVKEAGATLVMVTHDHSLLQQFDRTVDFAQFLSKDAPLAGELA